MPIITGATREERITLTNDREFGAGGGSTGNWIGYGSNVSISESSNTLLVNPGNTSTADQGAQLPGSSLETIVAGKKYRVSVDLRAAHIDGVGNFFVGIGGAISSVFTITTSSVTYTNDILAVNDENLLIYNENAVDTNGNWYIDNVSI